MDLSIVIPVYNVEKYLEKCILSVLNTTLSSSSYEILLINDGSTDSSPIICDEFGKKYKNIRTFHKKNGGLSDARNYGLLKAKGTYVAFVDSDDFIIKDAYNIMLKKALENNAEIVLGNAFKYIDHNNIHPKFKRRNNDFIVQDGKNFLVDSIKNNTMSMSVVLGIYRRDWILNNNLFFEKNLLHEDELWTPIVFLHAEKVVYVNHDFYYHYEREGSITQSKNKTKNAIDLIKISYKLEQIYSDIEKKSDRKILKDYLSMLYLNAFTVGQLYKKECGDLLSKRFVVRNAYSLKNRLKTILFCINTKLYYFINKSLKQLKGDNKATKLKNRREQLPQDIP